MEFGKDHGGHRLCSIVMESMVTWRPDGAWERATVDCCAQGDSDRAPHLGDSQHRAPGSWREGTQPKRRTRLSISLLLWFQLPWTWAGQAVNTQAQVTDRKILK